MFKLETVFISAAFAVILNSETGFAEEFMLVTKRVTLILSYMNILELMTEYLFSGNSTQCKVMRC